MYVRDTDIIVLLPGRRGQEHAGERFERGGSPENDLLPQGDEIGHHRIVLPHLPETLVDAMVGRTVREIVEIPPWRGVCPVRGCDLGGDTLVAIADDRIVGVRRVERGVMVVVGP